MITADRYTGICCWTIPQISFKEVASQSRRRRRTIWSARGESAVAAKFEESWTKRNLTYLLHDSSLVSLDRFKGNLRGSRRLQLSPACMPVHRFHGRRLGKKNQHLRARIHPSFDVQWYNGPVLHQVADSCNLNSQWFQAPPSPFYQLGLLKVVHNVENYRHISLLP